MCFMILGEKEFKKPILDELGQNRTNIKNWRRNPDQRVESWKNLEESWKNLHFCLKYTNSNSVSKLVKNEILCRSAKTVS